MVQGTRYNGFLWGKQIEGARAIQFFQAVGEDLPGVGDVLYLTNGEDGDSELFQYVRLTSVEANTTTSGSKTYDVVTCELGDPLRYTFEGYEFDDQNKTGKALIYTTLVADAAKYYGAMGLAQAANAGDTSIVVDSIYTHLVPSAQSETPIADQTPGNIPVIFQGGPNVVNVPTVGTIGPGAIAYLPCSPVPGTLIFGGGGHYCYDIGGRVTYGVGGQEVGTLNYADATITFDADCPTLITNYNCTTTFQPAAGSRRLGNSTYIDVTLGNRGYNYTLNLQPLPEPGTVVVDYMVAGKWYRLEDGGQGILRGPSGSGTVKYNTGTIVVTCGALPDVGTRIIVNWSAPVEFRTRGGTTTGIGVEWQHTVAGESIQPGTLEIECIIMDTTYVITDDGAGGLVDHDAIIDATGNNYVEYATGKICVCFATAADPATSINITYSKATRETEAITISNSPGIIQLANYPIEPGSVSIEAQFTAGTYQRTVWLTDDGNGNLTAKNFSVDEALGHAGAEGNAVVTALVTPGTINYNTGEITLDGSSSADVMYVKYESVTVEGTETTTTWTGNESSETTIVWND
ncbi:hypothetical protein [Desulfogranum japonicum]|uniref:hypothetical protein n=1 Tax=Desulfogranum japonicum TaxID=231447 RepID=UPI00129464EF|nr:hypothetical protein [Desulfogranum japonicum]